jgi:plastocyanin
MKKITALLAVAALSLAACGSSDDNNSSAASPAPASSSSSSSSAGGYGGGATKTTSSSASGSEVKVNMVDNAFEPKTISGKAGSTVKVELKNSGQAEHNFSVDSQKVNKDIEAGEDATVSVKIPASGSVEFYCEYHKGLGMTGTLKAS